MEGADLSEGAPPIPVRGEDEVLVVVGHVLGAGVGRAGGEVGVVGFEEERSDGGGGGDNDVDGAEAKVEEWAVGAGEGGESMVGFGAEVGEVSDYRPGLWARREAAAAGAKVEEKVEEGGKDKSGHKEEDGSHGASVRTERRVEEVVDLL